MTPHLQSQTHLYMRYISPIPVLHLPHRAGPYAPPPSLSLPILLSPPLSPTLSPPSLMSCMNVGVRVHVWPRAKLLHAAPWTLWVWNTPPPPISASMWGPKRDLNPPHPPKKYPAHICRHIFTCTQPGREKQWDWRGGNLSEWDKWGRVVVERIGRWGLRRCSKGPEGTSSNLVLQFYDSTEEERDEWGNEDSKTSLVSK